jgi:hypothetical protein
MLGYYVRTAHPSTRQRRPGIRGRHDRKLIRKLADHRQKAVGHP